MPELHEMLEGPKHMPHVRQIQIGWLGATGAFYPWPTEPTREQEPGSYMPVYIDEEEGPEMENPFSVGDRVLIKAIIEMVDRTTAEQYAVKVLGVGVCDDDDDPAGLRSGCGKPTIHFNDPESGEPDEAHAEDFLAC